MLISVKKKQKPRKEREEAFPSQIGLFLLSRFKVISKRNDFFTLRILHIEDITISEL